MKKALGFISIGFSYLSLTSSVFAQLLTPNPTPGVQIPLVAPAGSVENVAVQSIPQFVITLLFVVGLIIAIGFLIYGGIRWIMSRGDKAKVEEARGHIVSAIVGLVLIIATFFILNVVFTLLTGKAFNLGNLCIPSLSNPNCAPITTPFPTPGR